ncbi:sodium-dependent bicarbonate transport family permease [Paenibacillus sp. LC231]|uniref:sodium-dependent bicarbonate transport family permease n=1 Tax=Paenibacillus sp. LC231 TaxID=1120679 RepID=UPI0008DC6A1F|nr:sodium-dependent bicarbonate transport family permease [Paenibacillus sp. LC231]OIB01472.1 sodium-dependent bicarbonate transport family permease [Paenibacillus sp. LC231]
MFDIVVGNLLSPIVLFFVLGLTAAFFKTDLKFPNDLSEALSIYLLIAIGVKGGMELSHYSLAVLVRPIMGGVMLGILIPVVTLLILSSRFMKLDLKNSVALAATYGSVSIVTFGAALAFLEEKSIGYDGFMSALVVIMESPAIIVSLMLLRIAERNTSQKALSLYTIKSLFDKSVLKEGLLGKSVFLLLGSLLIGLVVGESGQPLIESLFVDLYPGILMLFLLNMGIIAGHRLPEIGKQGVRLFLFAVMMPILWGSLGVLAGSQIGLSVGSATLMGVLAGSSSYIAAPAAMRGAVPEANPSIYLGLSLGVTFPFNLIAGIPLYYYLAQWIN